MNRNHHRSEPQATPDVVDERLRNNPKLRSDDEALSNMVKDPEDWVTGDERMTGAQASYLKTLCEEAGEEFDPDLSKADASRRIDELQATTGRGAGSLA